MKKETILAASVMSLGLASTNLQAADAWVKALKKTSGVEKCTGIVKAGKNDCGANGHGCGGHSKKDNEKGEWVYVPKGLCKKITGGSIVRK